MENLNVSNVTTVTRVQKVEELNIKEPGLYNIPIIYGIYGCSYKMFNVLKVVNTKDFIIIVQNPNKETDIRVLYYNSHNQLFKRAYDMEDVIYLQKYNISWSDCIGTENEAYVLNEAYNFWLELVTKYNVSKRIHKNNGEKY